jgi:hypothetical protein
MMHHRYFEYITLSGYLSVRVWSRREVNLHASVRDTIATDLMPRDLDLSMSTPSLRTSPSSHTMSKIERLANPLVAVCPINKVISSELRRLK